MENPKKHLIELATGFTRDGKLSEQELGGFILRVLAASEEEAQEALRRFLRKN